MAEEATPAAARPAKDSSAHVRRLVERGQQGDRAALEELYLLHFDRIYSYLHMSVGNRHDAEDLTTQTFLKMLESIKRFRNSSGEVAWPAVEVIRRLGETARGNDLPVFYTRGMSAESGVGPGRWAMKNSRAREDRGGQHRIVEPLEPREGDVVLDKAKPSAFFGTPLLSLLIERGIDSLIVCGCTTSGCVRATVVDAFSNNFAVSVVADACFDRVAASHTVALFDMNLKYGNVVGSEEAAAMMRSAPRSTASA